MATKLFFPPLSCSWFTSRDIVIKGLLPRRRREWKTKRNRVAPVTAKLKEQWFQLEDKLLYSQLRILDMYKLSKASVGLVLTITLPDYGNIWFFITILSPLAGTYYWKKASRREEIKVKMMVGEKGKLSEIVVQGDDVQVEEMRKELQLCEKAMFMLKVSQRS